MSLAGRAALVAALLTLAGPAAAADPFAGEWNLTGSQGGRAMKVRLNVRESAGGDLTVQRYVRFDDRASPRSESWTASRVRRFGDRLAVVYSSRGGLTGAVSGSGSRSSFLALYTLGRQDARRIAERSWPTSWLRADGQRSLGSVWEHGLDTDTLTRLLDEEVVDGLSADPTDPVLTRVAIARTLIWRHLTFRLDPATGFVPESGGEWRVGDWVHPVDGQTYQVVHWSDIDDNSWTIYFQSGRLYEAFYEN